MRLKQLILIFICSFCVAFTANASEDISVSVKILNKKIVVGDKVKYELLLTAPRDYQLVLDDWQEESFAGLAVKDFGQKKKVGIFSTRHLWWFVFDTYLSGEYEVSSLKIRYKKKVEKDWKSLEVESLVFEVESLLRDADMDIKDIYGPVVPNRFWLWVGLASLFLLSLAFLLWLLVFRGERVKVTEFFISPTDEALNALDRLAAGSLDESQQLKEFFYELSFLVRRYIERQFDVKAPEMTTEEFLIYARQGTFIDAEAKKVLADFFALADMVKFAKYETDRSEALRSLEAVREFVEKTTPEEIVEDDL